MRPLVAATSVTVLVVALALAMWPRPAPQTRPATQTRPDHSTRLAHETQPVHQTEQHAALARLIAAFDALKKPYALGIDVNGALIVEILEPLPDLWTDENIREYDDLNKRFTDVLETEAEWVEGYVIRIDHEYARVAHTPDAILAAGLSPRPGRFKSREEAREWYDAPPSNAHDADEEDRRPKYEADAALSAFCAAYTAHAPNFEATEWRDLQREALRAMIDQTADQLYELFIDNGGNLVVSAFEESRIGEADDEDDLRSRYNNLLLTMFSPYITVHLGGREGYDHQCRTIRRGVGGRGPYDPDDILAAGLRGEPGYRPTLKTLEQARDNLKLSEDTEERTVVDWPNAEVHPQYASLARLIAALDALRDPYGFLIDENGGLAVHILYPPDDYAYPSYEEHLASLSWYDRFDNAVKAEAYSVDAYSVTEDFGLRRVKGRRPEDILAAGLSERPRRFHSREAELEWYPTHLAVRPDIPPESAETRRHDHETFRRLYALHLDNWESDAWRAIQRTKLQEMLDFLDSSDVRYELVMSDGRLGVQDVHFDYTGEQLSPVSNITIRYCAYFSIWSGGPEGYNYRIKRGVAGRGRYNPDDILAAGLNGDPGGRYDMTEEEKKEYRRMAEAEGDGV